MSRLLSGFKTGKFCYLLLPNRLWVVRIDFQLKIVPKEKVEAHDLSSHCTRLSLELTSHLKVLTIMLLFYGLNDKWLCLFGTKCVWFHRLQYQVPNCCSLITATIVRRFLYLEIKLE